MPSPELGYSEFREEVKKFNAEVKSPFCKSIEGGCCSPDILIQKEDAELIRVAIQKGEIPRDTAKRAQRRARDNEIDRCPFLGEESECTIYEYRPLACIAHGNGGIPKDKNQIEAVMKGSSEELAVSDLGPFSCSNCLPLIDHDASVPSETIRKSLIIDYEARAIGPHVGMREFLTKTLPHY